MDLVNAKVLSVHNPKTCKECIWIRKNVGWFVVSNRCTKLFYGENEEKELDLNKCKHEDTRYANDEQDITGNYCFNMSAHNCTVIICSDCTFTIEECKEE